MMPLRHWLPPVVWMGLILWLATDRGSAEHTGRFILPLLRLLFPRASSPQLDLLHALVRKAGHLTEYGVLAGLWLRAFTHGRALAAKSAAWRAWTIAVTWAVVDETCQSTTASRTGSPTDVVIDAIGALGVAARGWWARR
jgi:VanZ family protein